MGQLATKTSQSGTGFYVKNFKGQLEQVVLHHEDPLTQSRVSAIVYNNTFLVEAYAPC